jgi:hypothetical protein
MEVVSDLAAAVVPNPAGNAGPVTVVSSGLREERKKMIRFYVTGVRIQVIKLMFARLCFACIVRGLPILLLNVLCFLCPNQLLLLMG